MTNPPSKPPHSGATPPQRPKTAAQLASDANKLQQRAVHDNTSRPSDRRAPDSHPRHDHPGQPQNPRKN